MSGASRTTAWGLTNAYLPTSRIIAVPAEDIKADAQTIRPIVWVKVWKFSVPIPFKTFQRTREGWPILPIGETPGRAIVLRWSAFDLKAKDIVSPFTFAYAKSVTELDRALARLKVPGWNFVTADVDGKIGYRTVGKTFRFDRAENLGVPTQSLQELRENKSYLNPLSASEMPHLLNPPRGYIATANNSQWPQDAQFSLGRAQTQSFRAFRIEELIKNQPPP